jgi:hypothetical protein
MEDKPKVSFASSLNKPIELPKPTITTAETPPNMTVVPDITKITQTQGSVDTKVIVKPEPKLVITPPEVVKEPLTTKEKVMLVIELMESGLSERKSCEQAEINRATFRNAALREKVDSQYARALESLAMDQVEALESAITDMRNGTIDAQMARVEVDARKWFASKFLPKRFGDKIDMTSDGKALPTPIIALDVLQRPTDATTIMDVIDK